MNLSSSPAEPETLNPTWVNIDELSNGMSVWEVQLFSHRLVGSYSAQAFWEPHRTTGSLSLYRDSTFVCDVPVPEKNYSDLESFKRAAWDELTSQLYDIVTRFQFCLTIMRQGYPEG